MTSNWGAINRLLVLIAIVAWVYVAAWSPWPSYIVITLSFIPVYVLMRNLRGFLPDWVSANDVVGSLQLSKKQATIDVDGVAFSFSRKEVETCYVFLNHYRGYAANDSEWADNGNGLIYFQTRSGEAQSVKINVQDEASYQRLRKILKAWERKVPQFGWYSPSDIPNIMGNEEH